MSVPPTDRELPIWLRPPAILIFIAAVTAIRMIVAASTGLVRDEGYYTFWSTVPSAGYLDHPPMVAWLIAGGRALVGDSEAGVRVMSVLATAVMTLAVYRTGSLLFGPRVAGIAVIWFSVTVAAGLMFVATPDTPLALFWALTIWAVAEFVASRNATWWLAAGLFGGLALLSKYSAVFLGAGLLLYLIASRSRWPWLRLWQVWAGALIAAIVFLPNLIWNAENEWAGLLFQAGRRLGAFGVDAGKAAGNLAELIAGQALATGVILFGFVVAAGIAFVAWREVRRDAGLALVLLTSVPLVLYFVAYAARFRVEANWLLPIWPVLALAGAWAVAQLRPRRAVLEWPVRVIASVHLPLNVALVGLLYVQALFQPFELPRLLDRTSDMRGWAAVEEQITAAAREHDARLVAVAGAYGVVGEIAAYNLFARTGLVVWPLQSRPRWSFLPPADPALAGGTAILVHLGTTDDALARQFYTTVTPLGEAIRAQREKELERFAIYAVSGPTPRTIGALENR